MPETEDPIVGTAFEPIERLEGVNPEVVAAAVDLAEEMVAHLREHGAADHADFVRASLNPATHRREWRLNVGREPDGPVSANVLYWRYAVPLADSHPDVDLVGETLDREEVLGGSAFTPLPDSDGPDWRHTVDDADDADAEE